MTYREMGKTGKKVSRLGFGCMRFPEKDGKIDRETSLEMIDLAYKAGVNYYDTAYGYHAGESERFVGEALARYPRETFYLASKLPTWLLKTEADVSRLFNEQLEKCGVEYFDFYLLHALDKDRWADVKRTNAYEQMLEEKTKGRVRALGFSYHGDYDTFCKILDDGEWDFVQIQINYLDDELMDSRAFYDKLCEKGIPCVVMEPVRGGFLANLPDVARAEQTKVNGDSAAKWALRWCMDMDNMAVILSGMSSMEQVEENLATFSEHRPFNEAERAAVDRTREVILSIKTIPCTACGYCMDCAFGVDIPAVFRTYNAYKLFKNPLNAKSDYEELGERSAAACTRCGACAPMCPQSIAIPDRLADVHQELSGL